MQSTRRPRWWSLFLLLPLLLGLFYLEAQLPLTRTLRHAVQVGVIVLVFGLVYRWTSANTTELLQTRGDIRPQDVDRAGMSQDRTRGDEDGQAA